MVAIPKSNFLKFKINKFLGVQKHTKTHQVGEEIEQEYLLYTPCLFHKDLTKKGNFQIKPLMMRIPFGGVLFWVCDVWPKFHKHKQLEGLSFEQRPPRWKEEW